MEYLKKSNDINSFGFLLCGKLKVNKVILRIYEADTLFGYNMDSKSKTEVCYDIFMDYDWADSGSVAVLGLDRRYQLYEDCRRLDMATEKH